MDPEVVLIKFLKGSGVLKVDPDPKLYQGAKDLPILALSKNGLLNEAEAIEAFTKHLGINHIRLDDSAIVGKLQVDRFSKKLNSKLVWQARMIPLFEADNSIIVAAANPLDRDSVTALGFALTKPITVMVAEEAKILPLLGRYFPQQTPTVDMDSLGDASADSVGIADETQDLYAAGDGTAPIVKLANKIIADAVNLKASDIHLEPNESHLAVRFRIDGVLQDIITIPKQISRNLTMRFKVLAGMDVSERRRPQDGRIRANIGDQRADMRVSSIPVAAGEKLVLRLLRADYSSLTFKDLGMAAEIRTKLETALRRPGKMVLVSGPTGSGKTTTLYVALNTLSDRTTNITTIEDPIEYKFEHLNQIQVNNQANISFSSILRAVLRQDPDIIMIGEIRDGETLKIVLQAAQTGHLVLSTVHTNDAPSAVSRLIDLGGDPFNLSIAVAGILAQRLARKICEKCKGPIAPGLLNEFRPYIDKYKIDPAVVKVGSGCAHCFYSGFKGQMGVFSYLEINDQISELIYQRASQETLIHKARKNGFVPLDEAAAELVKQGVTTFAEALPYMNLDPIPSDEPEVAPAPVAPVAAAAAPTAIPEVHIRVDHTGAPQVVQAGDGKTKLEQQRVLIIDDNKSVRKMISTLLKNEMIVVEEAQNGREGLQKVYEFLPSLIICDLKMPEMDGKEFLQRVHHNKHTRDIPVIMLTVDDSEECEIDLIGRGAFEFLSKKSSPNVLVSRIRRVLDSIS